MVLQTMAMWASWQLLGFIDKINTPLKFMGPTWDPPGSCQPQMGPMLAPWTLLSGTVHSKTMTIDPCPWRIKYPTMHHFVTEMCTYVTKMVHCGIWDGALWDLCNRSIVEHCESFKRTRHPIVCNNFCDYFSWKWQPAIKSIYSKLWYILQHT